jgi:hypothetical protein
LLNGSFAVSDLEQIEVVQETDFADTALAVEQTVSLEDAVLEPAASVPMETAVIEADISEIEAPMKAVERPTVPGQHYDEEGFLQPDRMHNGLHYLEVIGKIDQVLKPSTYLEIGTNDGSSLKRVSCSSVAIDPKFIIDCDVIGQKPKFFAFQTTSDHFFETNDPKLLLGSPVKLAFLDGMHRFEFLLRDFMQVERHCEPNSLIMLHDCFPLSVAMTERVYDGVKRPGFDLVKTRDDLKRPAFWWTGDVWKMLWILAKYRPELITLNLDAAPTGLCLLTGLDPKSTVLQDNYFKIVHEFGAMVMDEDLLVEHNKKFKLLSADSVATESQLTRCFWF